MRAIGAKTRIKLMDEKHVFSMCIPCVSSKEFELSLKKLIAVPMRPPLARSLGSRTSRSNFERICLSMGQTKK